MKYTAHIAQHLRAVHFGGNWTSVNLQEKLSGLHWDHAVRRVGSLHSIATLIYHMNYFVSATLEVLQGGALDAQDRLSFDGPPITSASDWEALKAKTWSDAEQLASLIERLDDRQLDEVFVDESNGSYYRCLTGLIEHCHYHLGQIAVIRSLLAAEET